MIAQPDQDGQPGFGVRRYAYGELLLAAFVSARRPLAFDDLAHMLADSGAHLSEVLEWLAASTASGLIASDGYETGALGEPVGPRRYSLSAAARAELRPRRDRRARRRAAATLAAY